MTKAATLKCQTKDTIRKTAKPKPTMDAGGKMPALPANEAKPRNGTKLAAIISLLCRRQGATLSELAETTGWQHHSIRGAMSGTVKKKIGLRVISEPDDHRGRVYRISSVN